MVDFTLRGFEGSYLFHFAALLPLAVGVVLVWMGKRARGKGAKIGMIAGGIASCVLAAVFIYLGFGLNRLTLSAGDGGVVVGGPFYGASLGPDAVDVAAARVVDLSGKDAELRPAHRDNGVGLSNLRYGWFTLANGERALLALSDESAAVYIPTREGYALLVSPDDPEAFLVALRSDT